MSNQSIPPQMMMRSFLTVASGYVVCLVSLYAIMLALGYAFFPDFVDFSKLDPQTQDTIMEDNPGNAISRSLFLLSVLLGSISCMAVGWVVIRTAPFAPMPHAVFLAVLLFIHFLQMAIADPPLKKSMTLVFMVAFPISVLIGAKWAFARGLVSDDSGLESGK